MRHPDIFVGIVHFSTHSAAEFKAAYPMYEFHDNGQSVLRTHFRLDLDSLKTRIFNMGLKKNGGPKDVCEEFKAFLYLIPPYLKHLIKRLDSVT